MNIENVIRKQYGENAVPHKRLTPFKDTDLMVAELDGGIKCRVFSPSTPNGLFVVEYYGASQMYRLDFDFLNSVVSVKQHILYPPDEHSDRGYFEQKQVAVYTFYHDPHTLKVTFTHGENLFFNDVRDALANYFSVQNNYLWIEK